MISPSQTKYPEISDDELINEINDFIENHFDKFIEYHFPEIEKEREKSIVEINNYESAYLTQINTRWEDAFKSLNILINSSIAEERKALKEQFVDNSNKFKNEELINSTTNSTINHEVLICLTV